MVEEALIGRGGLSRVGTNAAQWESRGPSSFSCSSVQTDSRVLEGNKLTTNSDYVLMSQ